MAKILFIVWPSNGHINPSLSLVSELVARDHEVHYYTGGQFSHKLAKLDVEFHALQCEVDDLSSLGEPNLIQMAHGLVRENLKILSAHEQEWSQGQYDCIVHDSLMSCGFFFGTKNNIFTVNSQTTFAANIELLTQELSIQELLVALKDLDRAICYFITNWKIAIRYKKNLSMIEYLCPPSNLVVVYTSSFFQIASESFAKEQFLFIGPTITAREQTNHTYPAIQRAQEENKKILYISLGTLFNNNLEFFGNCIHIFRDNCDYLILISLGKFIKPEHLGPIPEHFILAEFMPQLEILQHCHIFISHGGMNSVAEAILHSTPMIVCPQQREQLAVAKRVEQLGAGVCLPKDQQDRSHLQRAFGQIDRNYQQVLANVNRIKESFMAAPGTSGAVDRIEKHLM